MLLNPKSQSMWRMNRQVILAIIAIILLVVGGIVYALNSRPRDSVISGVPYLGTFSGTVLSRSDESAAGMILRYWGDQRLSYLAVQNAFQTHPRGSTFAELADFFRSQGYDAKI